VDLPQAMRWLAQQDDLPVPESVRLRLKETK
jgi:hypothetical protein